MSRTFASVAGALANAATPPRHVRGQASSPRRLGGTRDRRLRLESLEQRTLLSVAPTLLDANLSAASARDGQTITVGYEISSEEDTSVLLDCSLLGADGIAVRDAAHGVSVDVAAGTQWYTRQFAVNLPPTAVGGSYDVTWTLGSGQTPDSSLTREDALSIEPAVEVRIPVLMYHNVATTALDFYTTTTDDFLAQMRVLKAYGYTAVTVQDVLDYRAGIATPPDKPILLTFDDGYESMLTVVLPILADPEIDYRATAFVSTAFVRPVDVMGDANDDGLVGPADAGIVAAHWGMTGMFWEDGDFNGDGRVDARDASIMAANWDPSGEPQSSGGYPTDPLSWAQIRQLEASGRVDIQSHTVNHPYLTQLDAESLMAELTVSKAVLEQNLRGGGPVNCIAYSYGDYNAAVEMAAWEAGYTVAFEVFDDVELDCADKFSLDRIQVDETTSLQLDQGGWYPFFMSRIADPDVEIPDLAVTAIHYLDPDTGEPIDPVRVERGQTVRIRVDVENDGATADVIATLKLDSDGDPANGAIYDSHAATPTQDIVSECEWGESSFEWTWTAPDDAPLGLYSLEVSFHDPYYMLGFLDPGWQSAFEVVESGGPMESVGAAAATVALVDASLSVASARDGQTITASYQISSPENASVLLDLSIVGADGVVVRDAAHTVPVDVEAGTHWYTREFAVNLPPTAVAGAYDVTWALDTGAAGDSFLTREDALAIDPAVEVRIPVLMYHNVASTADDFYTTATDDFLAQMRALKAYGYTTVTVQDVLDYRAGIATAPERPILLTFDDGFESLLTVVLPILADPAIDFQATAFINTAGVRPAHIPGGYPTDPLSWSQIRELAASGRIDVQSHTVNHLNLTALDAEALAAELADSKAILEQEIGGGKLVSFIAYPYGACDARVEMAAWEAGYTAAFEVYDDVEWTSIDKLALNRIQMDWNTSVDLDQSGWYAFFMSRIADPDVRIPNLSVTGIQYLDPDTGDPIDAAHVRPGQSVLIRVDVRNAASLAGVTATLKLDSDGDPENGVIYDSHAAVPGEDVSKVCPWGDSTFEWTWTVPEDAPLGQYALDVSFHDPYYVLGFKDAGWQSAFQVDVVAPSLELLDAGLSVFSARDGQTIDVDYQISSSVATSVVLECTLVGADGVPVRDAAHAVSIDVEAGDHWYTREFAINLPPTAVAGEYDITWTLDVAEGDDPSITSVAGLLIDPPIDVRIPVLLYHNVATTSSDFYTTTTGEFLAQMRALKAYGYTAVSIQDVLDYRAGIATPPEKPIVLTFDDNYESLLTIVLPILADPAIDYKATAFICTAGVRPEDVPGGYPTDPLSWSQIRELVASGRIDVQSHTVNHLDLTILDADALTAELAASKAILEQELGGGALVTAVAYPFGVCDPTVEMAVWKAGYSAGFQVAADAIEATCADKFLIDRIQMNWTTSVDLDRSGWYEFLMSRVGDADVDVPNLSITSIRYLDPRTGRPINTSQVKPGQRILIQVDVNNAAAPAGVIATLKLDSDGDPANGTIFDSHAATPNQDVARVCPWGKSSFQWTWTVPATAPRGQYFVDVTFHDPRYVLGFEDSGWRTAFRVARTTFVGPTPFRASTLIPGQSSGIGAPPAANDAALAEMNQPSPVAAQPDDTVQASLARYRDSARARRLGSSSHSLFAGHDSLFATLSGTGGLF